MIAFVKSRRVMPFFVPLSTAEIQLLNRNPLRFRNSQNIAGDSVYGIRLAEIHFHCGEERIPPEDAF